MKILFEQRKEDGTYTCETAVIKEVRENQSITGQLPSLKDTGINYRVEQDRIAIGLYKDGLEHTHIVLTDLCTCTHAIPVEIVNKLIGANEFALLHLDSFEHDDPEGIKALMNLSKSCTGSLLLWDKGRTE